MFFQDVEFGQSVTQQAQTLLTMGHLGGSLLVALLCMVHLAIAGDNDPFDSELRCVTPPTWTSVGVNPMLQGRGNVMVVALLQAS